MRSIRLSTPHRAFPLDRAASSDIRTGYVEGKPVKRLVVTLRGPGCSWVTQGGGCLMCGHFAGTTQGILPSVAETLTQFVSETSRYPLDEITVISLYNSGSVLNPDELRHEALRELCQRISAMRSIRKVVFETRACFIDRTRLCEIKKILGSHITLTVAVGLETADDVRRNVCINKGCSLGQIGRSLDSIRGIAESQLYVLLGIPFLTEAEAIDDAVATIRCARHMGADEIHIEPLTLQAHSLTGLLISRGLCRLPSLHSIYEVLRRVLPDIRPYVSPFLHMPLPDRIPEGCPHCTERLIHGLLHTYNISRTPESLACEPCDCAAEWRELLAEVDNRALHIRISDALAALSCGVER